MRGETSRPYHAQCREKGWEMVMNKYRNRNTNLVNTTSVSAGKHILGTRLLFGTIVEGGVFVSSVHAVWIAVTDPLLGNAL